MDPTMSVAAFGRLEKVVSASRLPRLALAALCGLSLASSVVTPARAADDSGILEAIRFDAVRRLARAAGMRDGGQPGNWWAPRGQNAAPTLADGGLTPARPVVRKARVKLSGLGAAINGRRSLCVRTCDGYVFPLGPLRGSADLPAHKQACAASCPGAATALYTLSAGRGLDQVTAARSVADGSPYRRLQTAFLFQKARVPSCSCQGPDQIAKRVPILLDPTLRAGDAVVDRGGEAKVFAGGARLPHVVGDFADYRRSPALGRTARAQIDRAVGTSQREALARDFRRDLRIRQAALAEKRDVALAEKPAKAVPTRYASLREVAAPAGSAANVRAYAFAPTGGAVSANAPRIIEIR